MSLTRHLSTRSSPVRGWFARRLPHTAAVVLEANRALRLGDPTPALPSMATDERLVGTALDLLVRATLAASDGSVAPTVGALRLERAGVTGTLDVARQASDRLRELAPAQLTATAGGWYEVAKLCVLLARFEQAGRNLQAVQWSAQRLRAVEPTVDAYMRTELVGAGDVDDVVAAAPVIADDHADLRVAEPLLLGPSFALSGALGGADADVIAGALLFDLKAATTPRIVRGTGVWQIVGYALADTEDTGLQRVGFSALRWRRRWTVGLDELVVRLAGQAVGVDVLRREFADVARSTRRAR